jgi:hypothetical protein
VGAVLLVFLALLALCAFVVLLACLAVSSSSEDRYADPEWRQQLHRNRPAA